MSSAMADPEHLYGKTRFARELNSSVELKGTKSVGKVLSFTHFFRKFLFFALFLIAIPLFPSQAPDFINQTVLTKFWELVHLLFIGIAVSYGLFCRRNVDMGTESQHNTDDSQSYVSRVFNVSSIFEDGFDNSHGYGEKNVYQNWFSENYKGEHCKARSLNFEIGFEDPCGYGENNVSQSWNSQYFQGESMVVVNQENCAVNEYGHRSLGLPVRSLRSRLRNQDDSEISDRKQSGLISTDSSNSRTESINETFGDLSTMNLENRFNESAAAAALSSPIPWRSISGRMEMRDNVDIACHPSHFSPLSVEETQFESLKSQSCSSETFSSQNSSISDSPNRLSPSQTGSSELENFKMDELGKEKTFRNSYPPASKPENSKTSLNAFHIRSYTNGSLFENNMQKSFEDDVKDTDGNKREDQLGSNREWRSSSLKLDRNPAKLIKASSRGKSVRTIRSRGFTAEAMRNGERSGKPSDEIEAVYKGKSEMKSGGFFDNLSANPKKQDLDNQASKPKTTHFELQKKKNKEPSENFAVQESKEKSQTEAESFLVKSDEQYVTDRTIRSRGFTAEAMRNGERSGKPSDEIEAVYKGKSEMKSGGFFDNLSANPRKQDLDNQASKPKTTHFELQKRKNKEPSENFAVQELKEKSQTEAESFQVKSDEQYVTDRTIRSRGFTAEAMRNGERSGKPSDEIETVYKGKSEMKSGGFFDNLSANPRKQDLDNQASKPKPTHFELQKRKNKEPSENFAVQESKEKSRAEAESFQVKLDEQYVADSVNDAETDPNEVDKKAGEFIAKFREQIRLQKLASIDKSSREFHHFRRVQQAHSSSMDF